ncbi:MAG: alpha/beta fold hydrolase [Acidithiobacillus sp.]
MVFVHGFNGGTDTWAGFIDLLLAEGCVRSWDVFELSYPTGRRIDIPNLWAADPGIDILATELVTALSQLPLSRYRRIALVAHSMGGLAVQRAILDDAALAARLSHVICFGTPSNGLFKATLAGKLKRQLRDMGADSKFIRRLRADWQSKFGASLQFDFLAIQGDRDEFVSGPSSLVPFPASCRRVVPGNHLEIVRPSDRNHTGFQLVIQRLGGLRDSMPAVDGARLAVELGQFQEAVNTLLPRVAQIDDTAMVTLALALDGLGRSGEALELLEEHCNKSSAEALGVLGGRIKRRWLAQRLSVDLAHAREMYSSGLEIAEREGNHEQSYYHAINIAFLDLISAPATSRFPEEVMAMAELALKHCALSNQNHWCLATKGEAYLILNDVVRAEELYREAIARTDSPRERQSMYTQAIRVALRTRGDDAGRTIAQVFGVAGLPKA